MHIVFLFFSLDTGVGYYDMETGGSCIPKDETCITIHHNTMKDHINSTNNDDDLSKMPQLIQHTCGYTSANKVYIQYKMHTIIYSLHNLNVITVKQKMFILPKIDSTSIN